ncbi:MAG: hypothetical protein QM808_07220 [Steroidobacteraceae bacterium]
MTIACSKLAFAVLLSAMACSAHADTVWNESVNGDLSSDGLSPTAVNFHLGDNLVTGITGNAGQGVDRDYFTFTVPEGSVLSSLLITNETSVSGSASFIAIQAGSQVTVTPTGGGVENLLGFTHYGNDLVGTNILPALTTANVLQSGTYSVWIQETGGQVSYGLDFTLTPVPLPGAALLLGSGLLGMGALRRRAR